MPHTPMPLSLHVSNGTVSVYDHKRPVPHVWSEKEAIRILLAAPALVAACAGMASIARDILANDDPSGCKGQAATAMLAAIGLAKGE